MPENWREHAACLPLDVAVFFDGHQSDTARATCAACPVQQACLDEAIPQPGLYGIWGGTNPEQRKRIRLERKASELEERRRARAVARWRPTGDEAARVEHLRASVDAAHPRAS